MMLYTKHSFPSFTLSSVISSSPWVRTHFMRRNYAHLCRSLLLIWVSIVRQVRKEWAISHQQVAIHDIAAQRVRQDSITATWARCPSPKTPLQGCRSAVSSHKLCMCSLSVTMLSQLRFRLKSMV